MTDNETNPTETTYLDAGVDVGKADQIIRSLLPAMNRTSTDGRLGSPLGFGAQFELPPGFAQPVLVSGTDGVGTKLKIAFEMNRHDTVGIDLVAMCANDVVVQGAKPLYFLDYFATAKLDDAVMRSVIEGIVTGCEMSEMALIGGETAEMPDFYSEGEYDLAGFCVGIVEKSKIIDGSQINDGDVILGVASSGVHSNGFSLVRKLLNDKRISLADTFDGKTFGEILLTPTEIYVTSMLSVIETNQVHALAHITGGGLTGNLRRIMPNNTVACMDKSALPSMPVFKWIQSASNLSDDEMLKTFNCGIGMAIVISAGGENEVQAKLRQYDLESYRIGKIVKTDSPDPTIIWT